MVETTEEPIPFSSSLSEVYLIINGHAPFSSPTWLSWIPQLIKLRLSFFDDDLVPLEFPPLPSLSTLAIDSDNSAFVISALELLVLSPISHLILRFRMPEPLFPTNLDNIIQKYEHLKRLSILNDHFYTSDFLNYHDKLASKLNYSVYHRKAQIYMPNFFVEEKVSAERYEEILKFTSVEIAETLNYGIRSLAKIAEGKELWRNKELVNALLELRRLKIRDEED